MTLIGMVEGIDNQPWRIGARCADADPEIFWRTEMVDDAKSICSGCKVQAQCLEFALSANEIDGIWGGMTPDERKTLRHQRRPERQPGYCLNGHRIADVGLDAQGWCAQCKRDRWYRYSERRRRGLVSPKRRGA